MKEIKTFIRKRKAEEVVDALETIGIGRTNPDQTPFSVRLAERYAETAKLELICRKEDVQKIVRIVQKKAHTGLKGDGIIYVTNIEQAVRSKRVPLDRKHCRQTIS